MKTYKFNDLTRKSKKLAIADAREYLKAQYARYGTPEWEPNKQNCIEEARGFMYANNGAAYCRILEGKADDQK